MKAIDLGPLGLDRGAHLLLKRALRAVPAGAAVAVRGTSPELAIHLRAWCRAHGHGVVAGANGALVVHRGHTDESRWRGAERAGAADAATADAVRERPPARWGLAARGAIVEAGAPELRFALDDKTVVWADDAARLYVQAAAAQWDPQTAIAWETAVDLPDEIEAGVVQLMTYLVENETAALIVPARFLGQVHPHFREVMQLLAVQTADEARHVEVFTRRARLHGTELGLSTAGGLASLKTLLDERDFALASFLLSVLGEGSFLSLLWFLHEHAPDPITRDIARLAAQDESRHVAFGLAHLQRHCGLDPTLRDRLAAAVHQRHAALRDTAGLNEEVFDALVLLAAGSWELDDLRCGWDRVLALQADMDAGRQKRLLKLGFTAADARDLSALHTRNFM